MHFFKKTQEFYLVEKRTHEKTYVFSHALFCGGGRERGRLFVGMSGNCLEFSWEVSGVWLEIAWKVYIQNFRPPMYLFWRKKLDYGRFLR